MSTYPTTPLAPTLQGRIFADSLRAELRDVTRQLRTRVKKDEAFKLIGKQHGLAFAIIRVSFRYLPTKEHCNNFIMKEIAEAHRQVIEEEEQPRR